MDPLHEVNEHMAAYKLDFNQLAARQKRFEALAIGRELMPGIPVLMRLDGRAFHSFTRGLKRPTDPDLKACMLNTAMELCEKFHCDLAYTQSDEITLVWWNTDAEQEFQFSGRTEKLVSLVAAQCTVSFFKQLQKHLPEKAKQHPTFDARIWQVPNDYFVIENLLWRQDDAVRNSITMAAQAHYSQKQLHGVNRGRQLDLLRDKGINWAEDYDEHFKRGIFAKKFAYVHVLSDVEWNRIPEKHRPEGKTVTRRRVMSFGVSPIRTLDVDLLIDMLKDNIFYEDHVVEGRLL